MGDRDAASRPELDTLMAELRRPFTAAAVEWKIQTNPKSAEKSALVVAFIDARLVVERLNAVVGSDWDDAYERCVHAGEGHPRGVLCRLTVKGHTRTDVGWAAQEMGTDMGLKGLYSDAFKRAAVKFGIGVSIYALPKQWVKAKDLDSWQRGGKTMYALSRTAEAQLRRAYETWLQDRGIELFGQPLDHGDVESSQGDVETHALQEHDAPIEPSFGTEASAPQLAQTTRAMEWMGADSSEVLKTLNDELGYLPAAVCRGIALAAKSAKARKENDGSNDSAGAGAGTGELDPPGGDGERAGPQDAGGSGAG